VSNDPAMIDEWRKRGDDRFDPVRFRFIEAMVNRAAAHQGEARRILDDKVAKLLAAYGGDLEKARSAAANTSAQKEMTPPARGPLAVLVDHIARHAPSHGDALHGLPASSELKTLRYFRSTWTKLSADRRLTQSLAKVPENAGPLNSHHLVHRSLTLMRDLSPEYLNRFMVYVDALSWLDQANAMGADVPRGESQKKNARSRSG